MIGISICCAEPKPDFKELTPDEKKVFCRMVYGLRKRGYSVADAQKVAYRKVLEDSIPFTSFWLD